MNKTLIYTKDGSHSIYIPSFNEHYHSIHGAIQEAEHVYIEAGLKHQLARSPKKLTIMELGLGTGLNLFLTFLFVQKQKVDIPIYYIALEPYAIDWETAGVLNYTQLLNATEFNSVFKKIHCCNFNENVHFSSLFSFIKINTTLQNYVATQKVDLIFYDAFAPRVQPELWNEEAFGKAISFMNEGATLVTYCAKGEVKRTMKKVGLNLYTLQGPIGKREMLRAEK